MGITDTGWESAVPAAAWDGSDAVYDATYTMLLRVAFQITGSAAAAEDAVHDVFCTVGRRLATLDEPAAYLRVAVINRCRTVHRRLMRAPVQVPPTESLPDSGLTEFRHVLMRLSPKRRTAIVLRYQCDLSDAEIAKTMSCRESTVRSLVRRGLSDMRHHLTEGDDPK